MNPLAGMAEVATVRADAQGRFSFHAPPAEGPRLARAERGGVNYFKMVTPDRQVSIWKSTTPPPRWKASAAPPTCFACRPKAPRCRPSNCLPSRMRAIRRAPWLRPPPSNSCSRKAPSLTAPMPRLPMVNPSPPSRIRRRRKITMLSLCAQTWRDPVPAFLPSSVRGQGDIFTQTHPQLRSLCAGRAFQHELFRQRRHPVSDHHQPARQQCASQPSNPIRTGSRLRHLRHGHVPGRDGAGRAQRRRPDGSGRGRQSSRRRTRQTD